MKTQILTVLFILVFFISGQDKLTVGVEQTATISQGQYKQFYLPLNELPPGNDNDYMFFMLSQLSGDSNIYVSPKAPPTRDNCIECWKKIGPGGHSISIPKSQWPKGDDAKFYISIEAVDNTVSKLNSWVTGSSTTHIKLQDGETQAAFALANTYTYFSFFLPESTPQLLISVAGRGSYDDPDIFASITNPTPTRENCTWSKIDFGADYLIIKNPQHGVTYYIGIYAPYWSDIYFTVAATTLNKHALLLEGQGMEGEIEAKTSDWYKFYVVDRPGSPDHRVSVDATVGDPDLYVKFSETPYYPNSTHYDWARTTGGGETLIIEKAKPGWYWVAVFGYTATRFRILSVSEYATTELNSGRPLSNEILEPGEKKFYRFHNMDDENGISFTITVKNEGDLDAYIGYEDNQRPGPDAYKHKLIGSKKQYFYYLMPPTIIQDYHIGVHVKGNVFVQYSISVSTNQSIVELRDGEVLSWNFVPQGSYRYFMFDTNGLDHDVLISVYPPGWSDDDDPDLYVSQIYQYPTRDKENHTWSSAYARSTHDTILIKKDDPKRDLNKPKFYIAVYGFRASFFDIYASLVFGATTLIDGRTFPGYVSETLPGQKANIAYYKFPIPTTGESRVSISIKITSGPSTRAIIYVREENPPTDHEFDASSGDKNFIVYNSKSCEVLWIGVRSLQGNVSFEITARSQFFTVTPDYPTPHLISTDAGLVDVFLTTVMRRWWSEDEFGVVISCTLISGRTALYVMNNETHAGPNNYIWKSESWPGNTIMIPPNDPNFRYGEWTFAVEAFEDSDYFVSVTRWKGELESGAPQLGGTSAGGRVMYYALVWPSEVEEYHLHIRVLQGSVNVYADQIQEIPDANATFKSENAGLVDRTLVLPSKDLIPGGITFAVYGASGVNSMFELTFTPSTTPKYLRYSHQEQFIAKAGEYEYFRMYNTRIHPDRFHLRIEACDNYRPPSAYLSFNNPYPSKENHNYSSVVDRITHTHKLDCSLPDTIDHFYVSVLGGRSDSIYVLHPYTGDGVAPIPKLSTIFYDSYKKGQLTVSIPTADHKFPHVKQLTYGIYVRQVSIEKGKPVNPPNMYTACGVEHNSNKHGEKVVPTDSETQFLYVIDNIDYDKIYVMNVIVKDGHGLSTAYDPRWIIQGKLYDYNNGRLPGSTGLPLSVGGLLIMISIVIFSSYIVIGIIINSSRGMKGLHVIPNFKFWMDLPYLVKDGFMFAFSCGRSPYKHFEDTSPSVNPAIEPAPEHDTTGGYGTVE